MATKARFCVLDPFTSSNYADVVLRSADEHDFHVMRGILAIASPVFMDMFSLPQPPAIPGRDTARDLPIVHLSESGAVVDALLRYIYPVDTPELSSLEFSFDVLRAAHKYDMDRALHGAKRVIREFCSRDRTCVLQTFVLSCTHYLEDEVRLAALETLPHSLLDASFIHTLDPLPARAVLCLFLYHDKVVKKIGGLFSYVGNLPSDIAEAISCHSCVSYSSPTDHMKCGSVIRLPGWWVEICRNISNGTHARGPLSEKVFSRESLTDGVLSGCNHCRDRLLRFGIDRFYNVIRTEMKRVASEVEYEIPWKAASRNA